MSIRRLFLTALTGVTLLVGSPLTWAHCDRIDGPVVADGRRAIADGELAPALKWIGADHEGELREIFELTMTVRKDSGAAAELADRYFFENLVRLHRLDEGAPFTGLKPADAPTEPGTDETDHALEAGDPEALIAELQTELAGHLREKFEHTQHLRRTAEESAGQGRAYVHAYADLVHYVVGLKQMIGGGHASHAHEQE
mgnify:CR=1 FL=1